MTTLTYHHAKDQPAEPYDEDYIIHQPAWGPDRVVQCMRTIWTAPEGCYREHDMLTAIMADMDAQNFWSDVWIVDERGWATMVIIEEDTT